MESKSKTVNWEKLSVYFSGLAILITLWTSLHQSQRDISDIKERVAKLEVKVDKLENLKDRK